VFLTLTSTAKPATDLGFLLHKHPERVQSFELPVGLAHVYYPEATKERCTVALHVEVDPIALVRGRSALGRHFSSDGFALGQYVNDRPYAASSLLAVALGRVFGSALKGRCTARPDLVDAVLPLEVHVPALPAPDGADVVERLFAPLGWAVDARVVPLDARVPRWGDAPYVDAHLTGELTLASALEHLYVLLPVLDGAKHYWVGPDEVDKLVRTGGSWLAAHPERELIARRYLARRSAYVTDALARLDALDDHMVGRENEVEDGAGSEAGNDAQSRVEVAEKPTGATESAPGEPPTVPLARQRAAAVVTALHDVGAHRVVDLGCGEGELLRDLLADPTFTEVLGVDVSARALETAERRLGLDRMPDTVRARLRLRQSSATYRDPELEGRDAVVLMEVVEHVDPERLPDLVRSVFARARPSAVVVTTPNAEHNVLYPHLAAGTMRHRDHRFEWTRAQFRTWATTTADEHAYAVSFRPVGPEDEVHGPPTQLALFTRVEPTR